MPAAAPYWFRAHTYGFGWGPATWQGWVILGVWIGAFVDGSILLHGHGLARLAFAVTLIALLCGICYLKGEPLKWRWGRCDT